MLFYKVSTPIGKVIIRSCCGKEKKGFCYCYNHFQYHKRMTMEQYEKYQDCRHQTIRKIKHKERNDVFLL